MKDLNIFKMYTDNLLKNNQIRIVFTSGLGVIIEIKMHNKLAESIAEMGIVEDFKEIGLSKNLSDDTVFIENFKKCLGIIAEFGKN
ncbi:MAG TPA: hypothetical protein HA367_06290 [Candidatus Methanofastidiosum sp.]|nr:hypothetical protein [Methanofastidiosum sp.]